MRQRYREWSAGGLAGADLSQRLPFAVARDLESAAADEGPRRPIA
jgi:hypothetical protein